MSLAGWKRFLSTRAKGARVELLGHVSSTLRLYYLFAAKDCGLVDALGEAPATEAELGRHLEAKRDDLLAALLRLGLALKELKLRGEHYHQTGRLSRLLAAEADVSDPLWAGLYALMHHHNSSYRHFRERLHGAPLGDYDREEARIIARAARLWEPYLLDFLRSALTRRQPATMLDLGCGSGIYLRRAAETLPALTGVGLEKSPEVAAEARANLSRWGHSERIEILCADVRRPPDDLGRTFDLITAFQMLDYFPSEERRRIFGTYRRLLTPGGCLAVVTETRSATVFSAHLDLLEASTSGEEGLPVLATIEAELAESGFTLESRSRVIPGGSFYGLLAVPEVG